MNSKLQEAIADGVVADLLREAGASETEVRFALEALSKTGQAKRRELRLLRMYVAAIARIARQPWEADDMGRVLDLTEIAQVPGRGIAAQEWADRRRFAKLVAGGHTYHCASRIVWTGECECSVGDASKVGRLPPNGSVTGWLEHEANRSRASHRAAVEAEEAEREATRIRCAVHDFGHGLTCSRCDTTLEQHRLDLERAGRIASIEAEKPEGAPRQCSTCGAPATRECPEAFQFVCGAPLCGSCACRAH